MASKEMGQMEAERFDWLDKDILRSCQPRFLRFGIICKGLDNLKSLIFYSALYTGSAAVVKITGFFVTLWLARVLSVSDYAMFGLLYTTQQGLATFALAGILESVIGLLKDHKDPTQRLHLFGATNRAFLIMSTCAVVSVALALVLWRNNFDSDFVTLASVYCSGVLLAFSSFQAQIVRLEERHYWSLLYSFFPPLIGVACGFAAFIFAQTVTSFFIATAGGILISLIVLWAGGVGVWRITGSLGDSIRILKRASPFVAVAFLGWLSGYGNNYVIDFYFLRADVARFTFALSLCSVMLLIAGALNQVWSPRFYRLINEVPFEQIEGDNRRFYNILGLALGLIGAIIVTIFQTALDLMGGNLATYRSLDLELSLLFAGYIALTPWWHCQNHFLSHAMGKSILRITLATSFIGIFILLLLINLLGPIGVYIGFFAQMMLRSAGMVFAAKKHWSLTIPWVGVIGGLTILLSAFIVNSATHVRYQIWSVL